MRNGRPSWRSGATRILTPLQRAATMKPFIVLDGSATGIFANHRHNLDAYISEARQKMYSIREELAR